MIYTIELLDDKALRLLRDLEQLKLIRLIRRESAGISIPSDPKPKKTFNATRLDTRGFKFNREEANER